MNERSRISGVFFILEWFSKHDKRIKMIKKIKKIKFFKFLDKTQLFIENFFCEILVAFSVFLRHSVVQFAAEKFTCVHSSMDASPESSVLLQSFRAFGR